MSLLEVKNLSVAFKLENKLGYAVKNVSFSLKKGETLGIVGESGCGKSVTAMSIMRLLPSNAVITSGEIIYDGRNILQASEREMQELRGSKIALVPQDPMTSLNPLYTIGDQIEEAVLLHNKGISKEEAKKLVIESLKSVKIPEPEKRYNSYPHEFSGGMRQRVIIAMALSCNPELIIADEPTTALDVTVQAQILDLISQIRKERNMSVILITHDLGVVANNADKVAVMYGGRIVEFAKTETIFKEPKHPYTKALLEARPSIKEKKLKNIEGKPPEIGEDIKGCLFFPRCEICQNPCYEDIPELKELCEEHLVACVFAEEKEL